VRGRAPQTRCPPIPLVEPVETAQASVGATSLALRYRSRDSAPPV